MAIAPGARIGIYEVVSLIGSGGMGEVYLARDTQLGRNVALKVLPDMFASDAERLARFRREAQVLAALHHPNIAVIHGLEDADGARALVLEYIEGDTLADRIAAPGRWTHRVRLLPDGSRSRNHDVAVPVVGRAWPRPFHDQAVRP